MAKDTTEMLGFKVEPSQDSFTFVNNSRANSSGMIRNVKVEIGECTVPVDFYVLQIKSCWKSSLLFGRSFMATVGAVCDLKKKKMCLTNVDKSVFYDHVEKNNRDEFISCIEMSKDPAPTADLNRETAESASASIDTQPTVSVDTIRTSKQTETEKIKSGGRTRKKTKKKKVDADFLSLVPSQCHEGSFEYRVFCKGGLQPFTKVRVQCDPELRGKGKASARSLINCINHMRKRDT